MDSMAAAAVVKSAWPTCDMIQYNADSVLPLGDIDKNEPVFLVGISLPYEMMDALNRWAKLHWFIQKSPQITDCLSLSISGLVHEHQSACELAYRYLFGGMNIEAVPRALRLIGRYETEDHGWDPDVVPFHYGMLAIVNLSPCDPIWNTLIHPTDIEVGERDEITVRVTAGRYIHEYELARIARESAMLREFGERHIQRKRPVVAATA